MSLKLVNVFANGEKNAAIRKKIFAAQLGRSYAGRVERGEQNISMQSLIQIALVLEVKVSEFFPPLKELKTPFRKRLEKSN